MPDLFRKTLLQNALLILAAAILYCSSIMTYGPGITDDSINYLSAGSSFPSLIKIDGTAFIEWPPLYPALLSLYKITGMNVLNFAAMINGLSFCISIVLFHSITKKYFQSPYVYGLYLICLLFSLPLLQSFIFIWSEGIFILLILITIISLSAYLKKTNITNLILLVLLSMLMCLQRKSGIIFAGAFALILVLYKRENTKLSVLKISAFFVLSTMPFFLWTYRRYMISGAATSGGTWEPGNIWKNVGQSIDILSSWLMPDEIPLLLRAVMLLAGLLIFIFILRKSQPSIRTNENQLVPLSIITVTVYVITLCFIFLYLKADEPIDDRLLSPVYLPFIFCLFRMLDQSMLQLPKQPILRKTILVFLTLIPLYFVVRTSFHIGKWNKSGTGGYNTQTWADNLIIKKMVADNPPLILSNNIYALNYYMNFKNNSGSRIVDSRRKISDPHFIIAYFSKEQSHVLSGMTDISEDIKKGQILYQGKEGVIIQE
jgi:hypothetical protein